MAFLLTTTMQPPSKRQALVGDIKNITPWAQMTGRWSKGSCSILLDYVTNIEITSLVHSGRNRHWPVFLALIMGFLCGASVALANALTFVKLFAVVSTDAALTKSSIFSFDNALELSNGTLPIPFDHRGAKPYAAVASQRLPNGQYAPWTKDAFAFESMESGQVPENATIEGAVHAFSTDLNCHPLNVTWEDGDVYHQVTADTSGNPDLNCALPIRQNFTTDYHAPLRTNVKAWLNVTSCAANATPNLLVATVVSMDESTDCAGRKNCVEGNVFYNITKALGVACSPRFYTQETRVTANASTGEIVSYTLDNTRSEVDTKTTIPGLWLYLSNPLDAKLQNVYAGTNVLPTGSTPVADGFWVTTAVKTLSDSNITVDPFFTLLVNGQQESSLDTYLENPDQLRPAVEALGGDAEHIE
ncbi:hypothetical protein SLS58_005767 [Diplodia intermedia]|uniref:Uncharacterized protein n=1 Tax=Diplodia intermedia TaxID=856260 RepID=A0ABR3TPY5_9PEZI